MRSVIKLLALSIVLPAALLAQQKQNSRPLKGLDASKIPVIGSVKQYINDHKNQPTIFEKMHLTKNGEGTFGFAPSASQTIKLDPARASSSTPYWKVVKSANGTINWMWAMNIGAETPHTQSLKKNDGLAVLSGLKNYLLLKDPKSELRLMSDERDDLGCEHQRYAQYYQGVPVWNSDLYVHFNINAEPYIINGTYQPTPNTISVTPALNSSAVTVLAIHDLMARNEWAPVKVGNTAGISFSNEPVATLVLFPVEGKEPKLAYQVEINANILQSYYYIIDATTGEIIQRTNHYCSLQPFHGTVESVEIDKSPVSSFAENTPAQVQAGFVDAQAGDLNGVIQNIRSYQHTDGNYYLIWDLPSFNAGASQLPDQPSGGALTLTLKSHDYAQGSTIFHNTTSNNIWIDPAAVSAHKNASVAYNYYKNTFSRNAIDDKNGVINSIIHVTDNGGGMDNAFWNGGGKVMVYGDGFQEFKPLAGGLDVAGHEMTHGVTENSANLVYQNQSGALNESMSDVFGIMIDPSNLLIGEQVIQVAGKTCLRDMSNPHNPEALSDQPAKMSEFQQLTLEQDNGGVHVNSGIPNHAAGILVQALGRDKVQKMYYRALTKYLTREAQFIDCRRAVIAAANDLFGTSSAEATAVGNAFDQVEIFDNTSGGGNDNIPSRTGGIPIIAFSGVSTNSSINGRIGFVDKRTDSAFFFNNNLAFARLGSQTESPAILTMPRDGVAICFVDQANRLSFVFMSDGSVVPLTLHIQQDGDIWNASISPDGKFVAMTSAYENDPNIYFYDGNSIVRFPLTPQSNDGGAVSSIDYPDVISWSPSTKDFRIGFDAFNLDTYGGTQVGYWSIYESVIDTNAVNSSRTYSLIPAADKTIDIGNISYGNTNPDVFAFNALSNNVEDVLVANFDQNSIVDLSTYTRTINGNAILDANRPTYSPDDKQLCFSSISNASLLYYDIASTLLVFQSYANLGFALAMPYWGLVGGQENGVNTHEQSGISITAMPSTIYSTASISFDLKEAAAATIDLVNIYGVTVQTIASGHFDAGTSRLNFNRSGIASGTYFIRLRTNDTQVLTKTVIE